MDLSKKDRILLINQYNILKNLDKANAKHYNELIEILQDGYEIFYDEINMGLSDNMSIPESRLVFDILGFYRVVEDYKRNNPGDKDIEGHLWSIFRGFDGNNEARCLGFARFLIEKQGKFTEQLSYKAKTDFFNSHMATKTKYEKMVQKWYEIAQDFSIDVSKENILEVLNA